MKRVITIGLFVAILIAGGWWVWTRVTQQAAVYVTDVLTSPAPNNSSAPTPAPTIIEYQDTQYAYRIFPVSNLTRLTLILNLPKSVSAQELIETHGCSAAINGGFYEKDGTPIGLFITDSKTQHEQETNNLTNGIFWITPTEVGISRTLPEEETPRLALQTGPLLITDGQVQTLKLITDELARRSFVATTGNAQAVFGTVYDADSVYSGPTLTALPQIVAEIGENEGYTVASAVNLDGGSASFFRSEELTLSELSPVGSLFCLK